MSESSSSTSTRTELSTTERWPLCASSARARRRPGWSRRGRRGSSRGDACPRGPAPCARPDGVLRRGTRRDEHLADGRCGLRRGGGRCGRRRRLGGGGDGRVVRRPRPPRLRGAEPSACRRLVVVGLGGRRRPRPRRRSASGVVLGSAAASSTAACASSASAGSVVGRLVGRRGRRGQRAAPSSSRAESVAISSLWSTSPSAPVASMAASRPRTASTIFSRDGGAVVVELDPAVPQPAEQVLADVGQLLQLVERQEPARALDGVDRAEDAGQQLPRSRVLLQRQ